MRNSKALGAPAFLKSQGFAFEKIPRRIDAALLSALGPADRTRLQMIWSVRNMGFSSGLEMYEVPKTAKQAALLFSYDWPRAVATLDWFASALARVGAQSMAEMGCGAGFLLAYLKHQGASTTLGGIDAAGNLASIAAQLVGCEIVVGDYLVAPPPRTYDLVLCDFGFDTAKFAPSQKPHSISEISGQEYCPNCSDDLKLQLDKYMNA